MGRSLSLAALVALTCVLVPAAPATAADAPSISPFLKIRTGGTPVLLPDGSLLRRDWPDGVWQLYHVKPGANGSLDPAQAQAVKLTDFPDGLGSFSVSPTGKHVVLAHGRGGDENTQLTLVDMSDPSKRTPVVADPKVQAQVNRWMRDGSGFFYSANATSPTDFHVYAYDIASGKSKSVVAKEGSWSARDVTSDGKRAIVQRRISASESHVFELDLASGAMNEITIAPKDGTASCETAGYLADEKSVLMASDVEGGRHRLYVRDLKSGKTKAALPALHTHELDNVRINDRRDLVAVVTNEDGWGVLHAYTLPDWKTVAVPAIEKGVVAPVDFDGGTLTYTLNNARQPGVGYAVTLNAKGPAGTPKQLSWVDAQGVDLAGFPLPELVKYPTFDGREIPALVYLPPGHVKGAPIPFVIVYHGGPESQSRPTFSATNQYLLTRGFGILLPNVRGSTGYGREFQMLDDYKKRWDSVKDGVAAADWLVKSGHSANGKIAATGGSYGGFMSVACVVEDQEAVERGERKERLFGACVDVVGIVNMKTFLERTSGYRRKLREAEYGPLTDPAFLESVSSLNRVDKIQVPMFIAHGFNDPRVPVEEAMQLAGALRAKGQRPRMFIAPDEGHGFQKLDNRIYYNERVSAFLEETLKGQVAARAANEATSE